MSTKEIAEKLNILNWYRKNDGTAITDFQIHGRTKNYPHLFLRNGSIVSLVDKNTVQNSVPTVFKKSNSNIYIACVVVILILIFWYSNVS